MTRTPHDITGSRASVVALACALACLVPLVGARSSRAAAFHEPLPLVTEELSRGVPPGAPGLPPGGIAGPLSGVDDMAAAAGGLWVSEKMNPGTEHRVDQFDASTGRFVKQLEQASSFIPTELFEQTFGGIAVGGGTVYLAGVVPGQGSVAVYDAESGSLQSIWSGAKTAAGAFAQNEGNGASHGAIAGVAVDGSGSLSDLADGDVYVATKAGVGEEVTGTNVVDVFQPQAGGAEPAPVAELTGTCASPGVCPGAVVPFGDPIGVAAGGPQGDVFVVDAVIGAGGAQLESWIDVFEPAGLGEYRFVRRIATTPTGAFQEIRGITVDSTTGALFVVDARSEPTGHEVVDELTPEGQLVGRREANPENGVGSAIVRVAIDPETQRLFIGGTDERNSFVDAFGPDVVVPDVAVVEPATALTPTVATLHGAVDPDEAGVATCAFEFGVSRAYGHSVPCAAGVPEGSEPEPVQATATGLAADTTYYYRLVASNANGSNAGQGPEDEGQFHTEGPGIHALFSSNVTAGSATLNAAIDPNGAPTTYFFQYGASTEYGSETPVAPGAPLGSGSGDVAVSQHLHGLTAGTVYHYRVVAVSTLSSGAYEEIGADHTFTTELPGSVGLPDGRAWEQVSPVQKHGSRIQGFGEAWTIQAAAAGNALTYVADASFETSPAGYDNSVQMLAGRSPSGGWSTRDLSVPHSEATGAEVGEGLEYRYFSSDLTLGAMQPFGAYDPTLSEASSEQTPYVRHDFPGGSPDEQCTSSCYAPLVTAKAGFANVPSVPPGPPFGGEPEGKCVKTGVVCGPRFDGATPDLRYIAVGSHVRLAAEPIRAIGGGSIGASERATAEYLWHANAPLEPVSVLPPSEGGTLTEGQVGTGNFLTGATASYYGAIASDGDRVVWTQGERLYLRDMTKHETVRIDLPEGQSGTGAHGQARFQGASSDESKIYFLDGERLTANSRARSTEPDLYECEAVLVASRLACHLKDVTPGVGNAPADVVGRVLGVSSDGQRAYFVANGALAPGAQAGACREGANQSATCTLYEVDAGTVTTVATLEGRDESDWGNGQGETTHLTAFVTEDGERVAFLSGRELTGYDNRDVSSNLPDEELFTYDDREHVLRCVSCNPTGARPRGVQLGLNQRLVVPRIAGVSASLWYAAIVPPWTGITTKISYYQSRYLDESGRVFFDSNDALVPEDVNGTWDVYEWEPAGVGDCSSTSRRYSPISGGCVALISNGQSPSESAFLDASANGDDVFFLSSSKLTRSDTDTALDVYDAHVCSAESPCAAEAPPAPPPCGSAEACRAAPTPQPSIFGAPSSATFSGVGNVAPVPAAKPAAPTAKQKLAKALAACHRLARKRRAKCERKARAHYHKATSHTTAKRARRSHA